jgi:hypothetical protein
MKKIIEYIEKLWIQLRFGFLHDLVKLWPGFVVLTTITAIYALGLTKPIFTFSKEYVNESGELVKDMTIWYNGILILTSLAWMLIVGAHILQSRSYPVVHGVRVDQHLGNANWCAAILIAAGAVTFILLNEPLLPTLLITATTIFFYGGTGKFHEQGEFEFPKLANMVICLLAVWEICIG